MMVPWSLAYTLGDFERERLLFICEVIEFDEVSEVRIPN